MVALASRMLQNFSRSFKAAPGRSVLGEVPCACTLHDGPLVQTAADWAIEACEVASQMLRHILLLQRDVPKAAKFYSEGLGLKVKVLTERWAELYCGSSILALKAVEGYEAQRFSQVMG